jgi:hypothetical protein
MFPLIVEINLAVLSGVSPSQPPRASYRSPRRNAAKTGHVAHERLKRKSSPLFLRVFVVQFPFRVFRLVRGFDSCQLAQFASKLLFLSVSIGVCEADVRLNERQ